MNDQCMNEQLESVYGPNSGFFAEPHDHDDHEEITSFQDYKEAMLMQRLERGPALDDDSDYHEALFCK